MTTDHELLAKINIQIEAIEQEVADLNPVGGDWRMIHILSFALATAKALRAVVEREEREVVSNMFGTTGEFDEGYNQCLAEIKADIKKELG